MVRRYLTIGGAVLLGVGAVLEGGDARACGGLFCDTSPLAMPVDQRSEDIVFITDCGHVEAHIQIRYRGDPARFAWLLPVPARPTLSIGTQALFGALEAATSPTFVADIEQPCPTGAAGQGGAGGGFGGLPSGGNSAGDPTPEVERGVVGAFSYSILEGDEAAIVGWLTANAYATTANTAPLLRPYLARGYRFVALRLGRSPDSDDIHPVVVRYEGDAPCVPIMLTAVGAVENMGIKAYFLGDERWVPTSYKHVELNTLQIDWANRGGNLDEVVARAVDSPVADGHAFVTEYAGPSSVVPRAALEGAAFNSVIFRDIDPSQVVQRLGLQGLIRCSSVTGPATCQMLHPLLRGLLRQYLPAPAGLAEERFWGCLSCYAGQIDRERFDGPAFADGLEARVIAPTRRAAALLSAYPYLTRLRTIISPVEMTADPEFAPVRGLPTVAASQRAVREPGCMSDDRYTLPGGRQLLLRGRGWAPWGAEMPFAEKITDFSAPDHQPVVLVDRSADIDALLSAYNATLTAPPDRAHSQAPVGGPGAPADAPRPPDGAACRVAPPLAALAEKPPSAPESAEDDVSGRGPFGHAGALGAAPALGQSFPVEASGGCQQTAPGRALGSLAVVGLLLLARARKRVARPPQTVHSLQTGLRGGPPC